jgi:hypothetical protein
MTDLFTDEALKTGGKSTKTESIFSIFHEKEEARSPSEENIEQSVTQRIKTPQLFLLADKPSPLID